MHYTVCSKAVVVVQCCSSSTCMMPKSGQWTSRCLILSSIEVVVKVVSMYVVNMYSAAVDKKVPHPQ